jgi:hypothetical protein
MTLFLLGMLPGDLQGQESLAGLLHLIRPEEVMICVSEPTIDEGTSKDLQGLLRTKGYDRDEAHLLSSMLVQNLGYSRSVAREYSSSCGVPLTELSVPNYSCRLAVDLTGRIRSELAARRFLPDWALAPDYLGVQHLRRYRSIAAQILRGRDPPEEEQDPRTPKHLGVETALHANTIRSRADVLLQRRLAVILNATHLVPTQDHLTVYAKTNDLAPKRFVPLRALA